MFIGSGENFVRSTFAKMPEVVAVFDTDPGTRHGYPDVAVLRADGSLIVVEATAPNPRGAAYARTVNAIGTGFQTGITATAQRTSVTALERVVEDLFQRGEKDKARTLLTDAEHSSHAMIEFDVSGDAISCASRCVEAFERKYPKLLAYSPKDDELLSPEARAATNIKRLVVLVATYDETLNLATVFPEVMRELCDGIDAELAHRGIAGVPVSLSMIGATTGGFVCLRTMDL